MIHYVLVSILSLLALIAQGIFVFLLNAFSGGGVIGSGGAPPVLMNFLTLVVGGAASYFLFMGWYNYFKGNKAVAVVHLGRLAYWIFYPCVALVVLVFFVNFLRIV